MSTKRFDHPNAKLATIQGYNGVELPDGVVISDPGKNETSAAEELYDRVGARFPVRWEPWSPAEPKVDPGKLPDGVSESDVESALVAMQNDGVL